MEHDVPVAYEIRVDGHLDDRWAASFDGWSMTKEVDGTTTLRGPRIDQSALHGVLQRLRDIGVSLRSIEAVGGACPGPAD